jgi:hypothetical protein
LPPDLTGTVDAEVFFPHALNLSGKKRILPIPVCPPFRISFKCLVVVIRRWGDWQLTTNRLDPELSTMLVDK